MVDKYNWMWAEECETARELEIVKSGASRQIRRQGQTSERSEWTQDVRPCCWGSTAQGVVHIDD